MATPKEGDLTPEMTKELIEGLLEGNRIFQKIPFDGVPGGDLSYTKKKPTDGD